MRTSRWIYGPLVAIVAAGAPLLAGCGSSAAGAQTTPAAAANAVRQFAITDGDAQAVALPQAQAAFRRYVAGIHQDPSGASMTPPGATDVTKRILADRATAARTNRVSGFAWDHADATVSGEKVAARTTKSLQLTATIDLRLHIKGRPLNRSPGSYSAADDTFTFTFTKRAAGWQLTGLVHHGSPV